MKPLRDNDPRNVGPYAIQGVLGSGGMGRVYLGVDLEGRKAAVKVIHESLAGDEQFRRRFGREISAAQRITSPQVAAVIMADPEAERPWLATTYIEGSNLQQAIETTNNGETTSAPLPMPAVRDLAIGVSKALISIHAAGVVHRDLKPTNILLSPDGPRVIDFGIARAAEMSTVTILGEITGSAGFMSPEQMQGLEVGAPSDLFSLGSVLFFAATGSYAFGAGSLPAALYRIVHDEPDLSAITDPLLRSIIAGCLHKEPGRRLTAPALLALAQGTDIQVAESGAPIAGRGQTEVRERRTPLVAARVPAGSSRAPKARFALRRVSVMIASGLALVLLASTFVAFRHLGVADALDGPVAGASSPTDGAASASSAPATSPGPGSPTPDRSGSTSASPSASSPSATSTPTDSGRAKAAPAKKPAAARTTEPKTTDSRTADSQSNDSQTGDSGTAGSQTRSKSPAPVAYASVALSAPGGLTAKAYFGRLDRVTAAASNISFAHTSDYQAAHPDMCVLTVVFRKVEGSTAAVYAAGLGSGWAAAEKIPDPDVARDNGAVHQQLITPPSGSNPGDSWSGSGMLRVDGTDYYSGRYTLKRESGGDRDARWVFKGVPITCSVS